MVEIDWDEYSQLYDRYLLLNPHYAAIQSRVEDIFHQLNVPAGGSVVDIGAGTGNFSTLIAKALPHVDVVHVEPNEGMNQRARKKMDDLKVTNLFIVNSGVRDKLFTPNSVDVVVCIHALYAIPNPNHAISMFFHWLKPGGHIVVCDIGRTLRLFRWFRVLLKSAIKTEGVVGAAKLLMNCRIFAKANRDIRRAQLAGRFWLHSPTAFQQAFRSAGFDILSCSTCYLDQSDLVVARK